MSEFDPEEVSRYAFDFSQDSNAPAEGPYRVGSRVLVDTDPENLLAVDELRYIEGTIGKITVTASGLVYRVDDDASGDDRHVTERHLTPLDAPADAHDEA